MRKIVIPVIFVGLALAPFVKADEAFALERLMSIIKNLEELGDEMLGEPVTGTVILGDTTSHKLTFNHEYMYHIYIWSDSYFNLMEFWLTHPDGDIHTIASGDNAALATFPDTTGEWTLNILLHEGAYSDTASYAAAVFRAPRFIKEFSY